MLTQYLEGLESSIQWAQVQDVMDEVDMDVLNLARQQMNDLMGFVNTLPAEKQLEAQQQIESILPMEWPLWMEVCRDEDMIQKERSTIH